jgi:hypothetical protein
VKIKHWLFIGLLVIGFLYVYHTVIANKGGVKGLYTGLGINR